MFSWSVDFCLSKKSSNGQIVRAELHLKTQGFRGREKKNVILNVLAEVDSFNASNILALTVNNDHLEARILNIGLDNESIT